MTLAIELTDEQARALAEAAKQLQVSEAELAAAAVRGLVSAPAADFAELTQGTWLLPNDRKSGFSSG
jgi:hypothetical protein